MLNRGPTAGVAVMLMVAMAAMACSGSGGGRARKSPTSAAAGSGGTSRLARARFTIPHEELTTEQTIEVAVTALYRSGPFLRIGFRVTCVKSSDSKCDEPRKNFRGDPTTFTGSNYGGFMLIDPVGKKEYQTVTDAGKHPFASVADDINVGQSSDGWAVFPAPPANVRAMDVAIPDGGPLLVDVPIGPARPNTQNASPNEDFQGDKNTTDTHGLTLTVSDMVLRTSSEGEDQRQHKNRTDVTLSSDVLFAFNKADLTAKAQSILQGVAAQMNQSATGTVQITGYTDAKGSPAVNIPLSKNRANAVAGYLKGQVKRGLAYQVAGKGQADPVAPNTNPDGSDNPQGRAKNRRVTVSYTMQQGSAPTSANPTPARTTPAPPGPVRWTGETSWGGASRFEVTVRGLQRHGNLALLSLGVKCVEGRDGGCELTRHMGDGFRTVRGFTLYRPATKTRYQAAMIDNGVGDTVSTEVPETTSTDAQRVKLGTERDYWIYFPAPDPGTAAVDVKMPYDAATVANVPVTNG